MMSVVGNERFEAEKSSVFAMKTNEQQTKTEAFFYAVTKRYKLILIASILLIVGAAAFLPSMTKDTSTEAFIPKDDPVLLYRDNVRETFGLKDPMVIAIVLFLTYHFIGIFAKNSAEDGTLHPLIASWLSTLIMLPLGVWLTYRATTDQGVFDMGAFIGKIKKSFKKKEIESVNDN